MNLHENCSENENFELRIADFADCIWDVNLKWRMNYKIEIDLAKSTVFDTNVWAIVERCEFSMKSMIEFNSVDFKLNWFEVVNAELVLWSEDSYDRVVNSNFEKERTFAEISKSEEIEIKAFDFRAFTIWFAMLVEMRIRRRNKTERINFKLANNCELIEFLDDSRESSFEKLNDKSTTFSKLMIAFLNSSRSIAQIWDHVLFFEDFDNRVFSTDFDVIDEFSSLITFKTKIFVSADTMSSNLWFVRRKSRIWNLTFLTRFEMSSFIKSWIDHLESKAMLKKSWDDQKTTSSKNSNREMMLRWVNWEEKEKRMKKSERTKEFCEIDSHTSRESWRVLTDVRTELMTMIVWCWSNNQLIRTLHLILMLSFVMNN
jgi:hypothetical protein